ncbi:hypothetical protein GAY29_28570 [Azospirillum brasilense]|uniref:hypothetical protein n=1 Tax=Azospirillum brasilense TaxID=192 RepID=UPI00190BC4BD|nr:hypothetical protein [Azospirillum brasilense]MBK3736958.1 hypothetical protein [Azospirillum brasilense]
MADFRGFPAAEIGDWSGFQRCGAKLCMGELCPMHGQGAAVAFVRWSGLCTIRGNELNSARAIMKPVPS